MIVRIGMFICFKASIKRDIERISGDLLTMQYEYVEIMRQRT
jgi:hypothetical protein